MLHSRQISVTAAADYLSTHHTVNAVIFSGQVIPADTQHLLKHSRAVNQRIDAGTSAMSPVHRDFFHLEVELASEEKNFRVESPAFNLLPGKNGLSGSPLECLETALCVGELQPECDSQQ